MIYSSSSMDKQRRSSNNIYLIKKGKKKKKEEIIVASSNITSITQEGIVITYCNKQEERKRSERGTEKKDCNSTSK